MTTKAGNNKKADEKKKADKAAAKADETKKADKKVRCRLRASQLLISAILAG